MFDNILYEKNDVVCRITLNRPHVYNALSRGLIGELTVAMEAADADTQIRVVVLTGAGDKAFSSGADLKEGTVEVSTGGQLQLGQVLRTTYNPMIQAIRNLRKPVIGRINGVAAGAGCSLALACDVTISADEAYFSQLFVHIGLMPDAGSTFFLPRLIGPQRAFDLCSTGRRVYGAEAAQLGLVNRSVPIAELDATVDDVVAYYASAPTRAIGLMKLALNQSMYSSLNQHLDYEADYQDELGQTTDAIEGIEAFVAKRKAKFSGR